MKFFLGTHRPSWLGRLDIPLFVSHRVMPKRTLPVARVGWALDSGGFTELSTYGDWVTSRADYIRAVSRYAEEIGRLEWAAPQDWMCEPEIVAKTGLTVAEHQRRTIENYLALRDEAPQLPFVPVLQGWRLDDYRRHADAYNQAGVDLLAEPTVGIGSVCRRQATSEIDYIVSSLAADGLNLHGFGVKTDGLRAYGLLLKSADSMAWSFGGRHTPTVCGSTTHKTEANCVAYALVWRQGVLAGLGRPCQLSLGFSA